MRNGYKIILATLFATMAVGVAVAAGPPSPGTWYRAGSVTLGAGLYFTCVGP